MNPDNLDEKHVPKDDGATALIRRVRELLDREIQEGIENAREPLRLLNEAIRKNPDFREAYELRREMHHRRGDHCLEIADLTHQHSP